MRLHAPVMFVGDRPNAKKNAHIDVAFVGTKSYKTLLEWCYRMDVNVTSMFMVNAHTVEGQAVILPWDGIRLQGIKVVCLGEAAKEALRDKDIMFFTLPHPSGLNRELNDKKKLSEKLARCKQFIYGEK